MGATSKRYPSEFRERAVRLLAEQQGQDALEQALHDRADRDGLIHHSDRGCQHLSIHYGERLAECGIRPSVGSSGDSYDNALAESIIGLLKTEIIRRRGPWKSIEAVEFAVLQWVGWFNHRRLLEPIGDVPPAEFEQAYYWQREAHAIAVRVTRNGLRKSRRGSMTYGVNLEGTTAQRKANRGATLDKSARAVRPLSSQRIGGGHGRHRHNSSRYGCAWDGGLWNC